MQPPYLVQHGVGGETIGTFSLDDVVEMVLSAEDTVDHALAGDPDAVEMIRTVTARAADEEVPAQIRARNIAGVFFLHHAAERRRSEGACCTSCAMGLACESEAGS